MHNNLTELLTIWKHLNSNESSIDLLSLVLSSISNLLNEAIDITKREDLKQILLLIPDSLIILRNSSKMNTIMKHKLTISMQKLLRSMLLLRDDKVMDIIDHITKLGSNDLAVFHSWKSFTLFSFIKHSRDSVRLNKIISDRIEMILPKLFAASEKMSSDGSRLLIQHYYRHALYLHMRYTQDVNFFNNPTIQHETEHLLNYIQDSSLSWLKGAFDYNSEDAIWEFIYSNTKQKNDNTEILASLPVQLSPSSPLSALNLLKTDLISLQNLIEELKTRRDNSALYNLHDNLQSVLKFQ